MSEEAANHAPEMMLRRACPLVHPPNYRVMVRGQGVELYRDGCLEILGERFEVPHDWIDSGEERPSLWHDLAKDKAKRDQCRWVCSQPTVKSYLYWLNWFACTYVQKEVDPVTGREVLLTGQDCVRPFVSWPCQDRAAAEMFAAITQGFDCTVDKSRQMGATWLICSMLLWFVLFRPNVHFAAMSRIEDLVDNPGDPQSIFWKIDFMVSKLPTWMSAPLERPRRRLKLVNLANGSTIMGRSTTGEQGRGGAVAAAFIDEASQIDELEAIWTSFGQSTQCRIANSTPYGAGYFSKLVRSAAVHKIVLPWWEHPLKGAGREVAKDPNNGELCIVSPFYIAQCKRESPDPSNWWLGRKTRGIAQELDMDHTGSGRLVFDYPVITRQLSVARPPLMRGEIRATCEKARRIHAIRNGEAQHFEFVESGAGGKGRWELWMDLVPDETGALRPPQEYTYVLAQDIAQGVGASESTLVGFCLETGEKVAQYRNAHIAPVPFAVLCAMAGWWFGGPKGFAYMIWEANGYGQAFGRAMVKLRYPWIYCDTDETQRTQKVSRRPGWMSNRNKKRTEYETLRAAMAAGEFMDPSRESLEQMLEIVRYESGGIGPAILEVVTEDARALHADIVTANVLAWYGSTKLGMSMPTPAPPPAGSVLWRRQHADTIVRKAPLMGMAPKVRNRPNPLATRR